MKTLLRFASALPLLACALSAPAVVVANAGFETYFTALANGSGPGYTTYTTGSTAIAGWTVTGVSVDVVTAPYPVYDGAAAVDLAGTPGPGGLSQNVATASGGSYLVSFYGLASANLSGTDTDVVAGFGATTQTFQMTGTYARYSFLASAATASTLLSLATEPTNTTNGNLIVDDISVQATPEPSALAALGLGAVAVLRRRKRARPFVP